MADLMFLALGGGLFAATIAGLNLVQARDRILIR